MWAVLPSILKNTVHKYGSALPMPSPSSKQRILLSAIVTAVAFMTSSLALTRIPASFRVTRTAGRSLWAASERGQGGLHAQIARPVRHGPYPAVAVISVRDRAAGARDRLRAIRP